MRNIDLYSSGRSGLLGGQVARIPSYTAKPYNIFTPASARYTFGADMIRALTAKAEKDKEDKIRTDMLAAMVGPGYEYDPSKASESFTPSPLMESHRVALANAQAQPEGVSALGLQPSDTPFASGPYEQGGELEPVTQMSAGPLTGVLNDFEREAEREAASTQFEMDRGLRAFGSEALAPPQFESTEFTPEFTPQPNLGDDAAMRAALIGDVATPEEELAAYAGSPEDRAAQERAYRATVNTPDAIAARMAEAVRLNPDIAKDPAYAQFVQSNLARQQALRDAATARGQAADVATMQHLYDLQIEAAKKDPYTGPFKGQSMDAQRPNMLLTGDPSTPEYLAAYVGMKEPKVIVDPATGRTTMVNPDMSPYRVPTGLRNGDAMGPKGGVQETSETRIDPQIKKTIDATITNSASLINSLISYRDAFTSASTWEGVKSILDFSTPEGQAWTNAGIMAKGQELFDLGVLAGEDLALIQKAFPDPSTVLGQLTPDKEVRDAVNRVINIIQDKISAKQKIHNLPVTDIRAFSAELRNIRGEQEAQRTSKTNEEIISGLTGKDREAYDWASDPQNRNTPQATEILKGLGIN